MAYQDFDFMGFTYNGKHSYRDLGVYRVSGGDRYEETFTPTFQEKTAQVDGMIGSYYFGQNIQNRQFNINFAFDHLTEQGIRKLKQAFNGDGIHDLIFDEHPYKVYSAKVTGSATLKTICFELEEGRVYRGEGTITFTCYYPYARSIDQPIDGDSRISATEKIEYKKVGTSNNYNIIPSSINLSCGVMISGDESWKISLPLSIISNGKIISQVDVIYFANGKKQIKTYKNPTSAISLTGLGTGNIYIDKIEYRFVQLIAYNYIDTAKPQTKEQNLGFTLFNNAGTITYTYSNDSNNNKCYANLNHLTKSGKIFNDYLVTYYPTKREWYEASGLPLHVAPTVNVGDLPAAFKVEYKSSEVISNTVSISVGSSEGEDSIKTISFKPSANTEYVWDSKTGTVCKDNKPVATTGNICAEIPVNGSVAVSTTDSTKQKLLIDYDFWYY